ncbi:hypothetical protein BDQ17DRAFT_1350846 [Cyathus striatus]|nr:hypothetical protein BDQ17DRAFT_1350846 [Cyathus striatus]
MPKDPTRAQLSSKLSYQQHKPAFLQKLQNRMADDEEFEYVGSGRPPIPKRPSAPKRPAIPERPDEDPGSADEDDDDEKPQVVVLKEGKHLSEREVVNIKRKEKGLAPLPNPEDILAKLANPEPTKKETPKTQHQSLSFSSSSKPVKSATKRKALSLADDDDDSPR